MPYENLKEEIRHQTIIKKFEKLADQISRNKHLWTTDKQPPARLVRWVDEYNNLIQKHPKAFADYNKKHGYETHTAYDTLA
jgi:hypothetical protein